MRCGAMRCDAVRCDAVRFKAMRCEALRYDAKRCVAMQCNHALDFIERYAILCSAFLCSALQYTDVSSPMKPQLQIADDIATLLRENFVQPVDVEGARHLLSSRRTSSYYKRASLEETRKSQDALLNMKFFFVSATLREIAYEQLTFSVRRNLHKKIAEWYEYT